MQEERSAPQSAYPSFSNLIVRYLPSRYGSLFKYRTTPSAVSSCKLEFYYVLGVLLHSSPPPILRSHSSHF